MHKQIKQTGLSLIELLVAMLISSVILIAIMDLYLGFGNSSREKKALSIAQDQANFALNELAYQVRMSGAGLCAKPTGNKLQMNPEFDAVDGNVYRSIPVSENVKNFADIRLRSFHAPSKTDVGGSLTMAADSDALMLSYSSPLALRIVDVTDNDGKTKTDRTLAEEMMLSRYDDLTLSSPLKTIIKANDGNNAKNIWVMVSDCDYSEIVFYSNLDSSDLDASLLPVPGATNSSSEGFKRKYYHSGQTGMIAPLVFKIFYVAKGKNGWALYEKDLLASSSDAVEVMNGVTKMKIEYFSGSDWQSTSARADWSKELPVKITLTMDEGGGDGQQREFTRIIDPRN